MGTPHARLVLEAENREHRVLELSSVNAVMKEGIPRASSSKASKSAVRSGVQRMFPSTCVDGSLNPAGNLRHRSGQLNRLRVGQLLPGLRNVEDVDCLLRFGIHQHDLDIPAPLRDERGDIVEQTGTVLRRQLESVAEGEASLSKLVRAAA